MVLITFYDGQHCFGASEWSVRDSSAVFFSLSVWMMNKMIIWRTEDE